MIKFLVSDVDGTLVTPDKTVTPAAREAVQALKDAGIGFAFVSSRPPRGLAAVAETLGLHAGEPGGGPAAAAFNGGALLDAGLNVLSFRPLGDADARIALDLFAALGIDAWVFTLDAWLLVDPDGHYVAHEEHTVGFPPTVLASFDGVTGIGKIVGSSTDAALLERAETALAPLLSTDARALRSQAYYLDVTHAQANKGSALRAIAEHAGLSLDRDGRDRRHDERPRDARDRGLLDRDGQRARRGQGRRRRGDREQRRRRFREGRARPDRRATAGGVVMSQDPAPKSKPARHRHAVEVVPDAASLATRAAEWLIEQIAHAVERRGRAVIALSGGSTPKAVFACLAGHPWRDRIDWDTLHLVWGDERFVADDDAARNARMTREALLDHVDIARVARLSDPRRSGRRQRTRPSPAHTCRPSSTQRRCTRSTAATTCTTTSRCSTS